MAKAPVVKFPRIQAGFYGITRDGEYVGYIMKEVNDDSKETNWWVISDPVPEKEMYMVNTSDAVDSPDALLREAKETAKNHFLNESVEQPQAISPISPLKEVEWTESEDEMVESDPEQTPPVVDEDVEDILNDLSELGIYEENDFDLDDELDLDDEFDVVSIEEQELSLV